MQKAMICTHHRFNIQKLVCRVVEVHDVYGVNITYEVARPAQRENFFKCSLSECHLNGECLVQVQHGYPKKHVILRAFQKSAVHPGLTSTTARSHSTFYVFF